GLQPRAVQAAVPGADALRSLWKTPQLNRIEGLTVTEDGDGTTLLRLRGSAEPTFNIYRLDEPARLVVDIASSERGKVVPFVPVDTWACGRVTVDSVSERGSLLVRVVIELKRDVSYIVVPDGASLVVTVTPREPAPEAYFARKTAGEQKAELERERGTITKLRREAEAVEAQARALMSQAQERASQAQKRARSAGQRAGHADASLASAREREQRAKAAEEQAQEALATAQSHRGRARRDLRAATVAREQAAQDRKAAEAERQAAREKLAAAQREAHARQRAAAQAEARAEALEADARARLAQAD